MVGSVGKVENHVWVVIGVVRKSETWEDFLIRSITLFNGALHGALVLGRQAALGQVV